MCWEGVPGTIQHRDTRELTDDAVEHLNEQRESGNTAPMQRMHLTHNNTILLSYACVCGLSIAVGPRSFEAYMLQRKRGIR